MKNLLSRGAGALLVLLLVGGCNFGSTSQPPVLDGGFETGMTATFATLSASATTESFGTVAVGAKSSAVDVTVSAAGAGATGLLASTLGGVDGASFAIDSDTCAGTSLVAGQTCDVKLHFAPASSGADQATLTVAGGGASVQVSLSGVGGQSGALSVAPTTQDFSTLATGSKSGAVSFTFKNGSTSASQPLTVSVTGANGGDFQLTDPCSGKPLAGSGSCQVSVVFAPSANGSRTASLVGTTQDLGTATAALTGTGAPGATFSVKPSTYDFGSVLQGSPTPAQTFTVQNTGGVISGVPTVAVSGTNSADFAVTQCTSALAAGAQCTFTVVFTPSTAAAEAATVTVSALQTTSGTASVTGTGLAPAAIAWSPLSASFGSWPQTASSPDTTFTLTNGGGVATGTLAVTLAGTNAGQFKIDSDSCTGASIAATTGVCSVTAHFAPTSGTVGTITATLNATGTPGGTTAAPLSGTALAPASLTISPTTEPFGTWATGASSPTQTFTVTNVGGVASGTLTTALAGADPQDFATNDDGCTGQTLAPKATCTVNALFVPQTSDLGGLTATLTIGDGVAVATSQLSGTSVAPAALAITAQTGFTGFGPVVLDTAQTATFTVTNTGGATSGAMTTSINGSTEYVPTTDHCTGTSLMSGGTCTIVVTFTPTATGSAPAQLDVAATPGGPATYALTGTGATQAALSIAASPSFGGFGSQPAGTAGLTGTFIVTNTGGVSSGPLSASGLAAMSPSNDFAVVSDGCQNQVLPTMGTCQVEVQFTPPTGTSGTETATLSVSASPGGSGSANLIATSYTPALLTIQPVGTFNGFGSVALGSSSTAFNFTLTNSGTQASGTPTLSTSDTAQFTIPTATNTCTGPVTTSCSFQVVFTPASPIGTDSVTITATATPGGPATYGPTSGVGTGAVLSLAPNPWIGTYSTCGTYSQTFQLSNTGTGPTTVAPTITWTGDTSAALTFASSACTMAPIAANTICDFTMSFACPTIYGGQADATLIAEATDAVTATASIDVAAAVVLFPTPASFGGTAVARGSTSAPQSFTLTNHSNATLNTITGIGVVAGTNSTNYTVSDGDCLNVALAPGQSCAFSATFTAPAAGPPGPHPATLEVACPAGFCSVPCPCIIADAALEASSQ